MTYESPNSSGKEAMAKVSFLKVGQTSRSRSLGQKFGTHGKVLSQGMYI